MRGLKMVIVVLLWRAVSPADASHAGRRAASGGVGATIGYVVQLKGPSISSCQRSRSSICCSGLS